MKKRLEKLGINTGPYRTDPYTGHRKLVFQGPDEVRISLVEY